MWAPTRGKRGEEGRGTTHRRRQRRILARRRRPSVAMAFGGVDEVFERTLGDILESLIGSHDCGCRFAKISGSKPCLDLEILLSVGGVGEQRNIRKRHVADMLERILSYWKIDRFKNSQLY